MSTDYKNEIIYICKCGCEGPKSGTFRSRTRLTTVTLCREHKERLIGRKQLCQDCQGWYMLNDRGPGSIRCPECAEKEKARRRRQNPSTSQKPRGPAAQWSVDRRGDYCRLLPSCARRECSGCLDFTELFARVDPEKWWVPGVRK